MPPWAASAVVITGKSSLPYSLSCATVWAPVRIIEPVCCSSIAPAATTPTSCVTFFALPGIGLSMEIAIVMAISATQIFADAAKSGCNLDTAPLITVHKSWPKVVRSMGINCCASSGASSAVSFSYLL
jgi:hypothetical protein